VRSRPSRTRSTCRLRSRSSTSATTPGRRRRRGCRWPRAAARRRRTRSDCGPTGGASVGLTAAAAVALAVVLDAAVGEPPTRVHPVAWFGRLVAPFDRSGPIPGLSGPAWRSSAARGGPGGRRTGRARRTSPRTRRRGRRSRAVRGVDRPDAAAPKPAPSSTAPETDLDAARGRLRSLAGRDAADLSAGQVRSAAVESAAENLADGLVAPLLAFAVGAFVSLPVAAGAAAWVKGVNTLDSMLGYREKRVGTPSARLDDAVMWLPARLSALLLAATTLLRGPSSALAPAPLPAVPNSGWPMATLAAVLGVRLQKPGVYDLPLGDAFPTVAESRRGVRAVGTAGLLAPRSRRGWSRGPDRAAGRSRILTRLPVGHGEDAWLAFARRPGRSRLPGTLSGRSSPPAPRPADVRYPEPPSRSRTSRGSSPSPASTTSTASRTSATPPWSTATETTAVRAEGHHGRRRRCDRRGVRLRRPRRRRDSASSAFRSNSPSPSSSPRRSARNSGRRRSPRSVRPPTRASARSSRLERAGDLLPPQSSRSPPSRSPGRRRPRAVRSPAPSAPVCSRTLVGSAPPRRRQRGRLRTRQRIGRVAGLPTGGDRVDALLMCGGRGTRLDADVESRCSRSAGGRWSTGCATRSPRNRIRDHLRRRLPVRARNQGPRRWRLAPRRDAGRGVRRGSHQCARTRRDAVLTVAADLPLLAGEVVDTVALERRRVDERARPRALKEALGASCDSEAVGTDRTERRGRGRGRRVPGYDARLAVNVNRRSDAELAERLLAAGR